MTLVRRHLLGASAAMIAGCARAQSPAAEGSLQRLVDETGVPALAGAVVTPEGLPLLEAAGLRRSNASETVTKGDLWHLGSNTKAMTAALYGRLVDANLARWDVTLPDLFPDLKLDAAWSRTTIEQVMGHTAGLSDRGVIGIGWLIEAQASTDPVSDQRTALVAKALAAPPAGKAGQFEYGNLNYIVVGAAIERIVRTSWELAITERLFRPLGLTSAGFGAPKGAQPWGHRRLPMGVGGLMPIDPMDAKGGADNPPALGPAGTAHMTLTDYAKFIRLFLTEGGEVLRPETVARLITPPPGGGYALGWGVTAGRPWARGPSLGHEGSNTMWHMIALVAPKRDIAFVGAANAMMPDSRSAPRMLVKQLQERFAAV